MLSSGKASSSDDAVFGRLQALPTYILDDIVNRLEDASCIAVVQSLSRELREAGKNVRSLRIICSDVYHERARNIRANGGKSFALAGAASGASTSGRPDSQDVICISFKEQVVKILGRMHSVVQLRLEVEAKLQSKNVPDDEKRRTDFWLTDHYFLAKCLPRFGETLQHFCVVDYGQQAIVRRSRVVVLLSKNCKHLKTLDLRNLFIDTIDVEEMPNMVSLTLRCVKVVSDTLKHLNDKMPNLETLALLGVFGADGGKLVFQHMKVLCLGLSTPAKEVDMDCPNLEKLQLKMQCPDKLRIKAINLRYVAFNLDVLEDQKVELISVVGVKELLYGAISFNTLSALAHLNSKNLEKLFLDIPCMALAEDGRFLGLVKGITLQLPSFDKLYMCKKLKVLNIGPGLWYSMEMQSQALVSIERWPSMKTLILHMIPHDMRSALSVLEAVLRPSVTNLIVFIHRYSPVTEELMKPRIEDVVRGCGQHIDFFVHPWQKSLDFSCFNF